MRSAQASKEMRFGSAVAMVLSIRRSWRLVATTRRAGAIFCIICIGFFLVLQVRIGLAVLGPVAVPASRPARRWQTPSPAVRTNLASLEHHACRCEGIVLAGEVKAQLDTGSGRLGWGPPWRR